MNAATNKPVRAPITPDVLVWARQAGNVPVEDLARSAGVTVDAVRSWESGASKPTLNQVRAIAKHLKRPLATFFLAVPPDDPPLIPDFRTVHNQGGGAYSAELTLELRRARYLQSRFSEELGSTHPGWRSQLLHFLADDDPVVCAAQVRERIGVSLPDQMRFNADDYGLKDWRSALYHAGVLTYGFRLDRDEALGFAITHDVAPLAGFNLGGAPAQRVFTLIHELGHLCLGVSAVSDSPAAAADGNVFDIRRVETFCNRFASAFLLPPGEEQMGRAVDELSSDQVEDIEAISKVARRLRVSKYVVLHRMIERERISRDRAGAIFAGWAAIDEEREQARIEKEKQRRERQKAAGKQTFGLTPVQEALSSRGNDVISDVLTALERGRLGEREVADLLDLSPKHFDSLARRLTSSARGGE